MHSFPQEEHHMQDDEKTKEQLIDELNKMRRRVAEFETTWVKLLNTEKTSKELLSNYRQMTETASEALTSEPSSSSHKRSKQWVH